MAWHLAWPGQVLSGQAMLGLVSPVWAWPTSGSTHSNWSLRPPGRPLGHPSARRRARPPARALARPVTRLPAHPSFADQPPLPQMPQVGNQVLQYLTRAFAQNPLRRFGKKVYEKKWIQYSNKRAFNRATFCVADCIS